MASLDAFLNDLDDLDDDDDAAPDDENEDGEDDDEDVDMMGDGEETKGVSGLLTSAKMGRLMTSIGERSRDADSSLTAFPGGASSSAAPAVAADMEESEYELIVSCNEMVIEIDNEIEAIAKIIKDEYSRRFPELDSLIPNPLDYARVVLKLGNEIEMSEVDLTGILPSATIMVVTVTATTTIGTPLPEKTLAGVVESCEQVLQLSENKQTMLTYVESQMSVVAPNLSNLVGTTIAAKLIGAAGGLHKLAALPSTVLQILGSKKRGGVSGGMGAGVGGGMGAGVTHGGFIAFCDLVQKYAAGLGNKVLRLVAGKGTLAARVDTFADKGGGQVGQGFRDEIEVRATKLQEPPPPKVTKALPVPPESSGKRRGGRRLEEDEGEIRHDADAPADEPRPIRPEEDTTSDGLLGVGMALSKHQQTGKMRVSAKDQKLLAEKNKKARTAGSSGGTNGLASSLAFTPVQGIELVTRARSRIRRRTETYFSKAAAILGAGGS